MMCWIKNDFINMENNFDKSYLKFYTKNINIIIFNVISCK